MEEKKFKKLLDDQTIHFDDKMAALDVKMTEHKEETKRHQKILLEEFDSRLKVVAEGHLDLVRHIEDHSRILEDHSRKLQALMEMVAMNTEAIAMNTETLEFIKGMLKRKVDLEEYERLEKRVFILEKKLRVSGV